MEVLLLASVIASTALYYIDSSFWWNLLEAYAVTRWFNQLYSLYYQNVPENLIWYLEAFQDVFKRGLVQQDVIVQIIFGLFHLMNYTIKGSIICK